MEIPVFRTTWIETASLMPFWHINNNQFKSIDIFVNKDGTYTYIIYTYIYINTKIIIYISI